MVDWQTRSLTSLSMTLDNTALEMTVMACKERHSAFFVVHGRESTGSGQGSWFAV
jgi:hypothetical protein